MKILYFTDTFYPMINGIVTSIETFAEELSLRGHEICIVVPSGKGEEGFSCPGVEILTVQGFPALFYPDFKITFAFTPTLVSKMLKFAPDVIHFHTQFVLGWQAIILGRILKVPRIGTFHTYIADEGYLSILGMSDNKIFGEIGWKYNNLFYKNIEHVIAPSRNARKELIDHGIKAERISVIPNPVPLKSLSALHKGGGKIFLDGVTSENIILYVGRISREKSLHVSLDAISEIKKKVPDVLFLIIGDGPEMEEMKEYVRSQGIIENVLFLGSILHDVLMGSDIFDRSKFFLTASTTETQGITLLEAMAFGLPVVWVDVKGVGEIIEDNGYKVTPDKPLQLARYCLKILVNPVLRENLSKRSREIIKKYDVSSITTRLETLYAQIIKRGYRKKKLKRKL